MAAPEWADLAWKLAIAVVGTAGGAAGGWFASAAKHGSRIRELERAVDTLQKGQAALATADKLLTTEKFIKRDIESLEKDLTELKESLDDVSNSSHDLASAADLARYIMENNKRWEQMIHAVGRIEGLLESLYPTDPKPRRREPSIR